jgi:hypothetical protein
MNLPADTPEKRRELILGFVQALSAEDRSTRAAFFHYGVTIDTILRDLDWLHRNQEPYREGVPRLCKGKSPGFPNQTEWWWGLPGKPPTRDGAGIPTEFRPSSPGRRRRKE